MALDRILASMVRRGRVEFPPGSCPVSTTKAHALKALGGSRGTGLRVLKKRANSLPMPANMARIAV